MELSERETVICVNRAELAEGYFTAATSEQAVALRLEARAKRQGAWIRTEVERCEGVNAYWILYLKAEALSANWLPVKSRRGGKGNAAALAKAREAK